MVTEKYMCDVCSGVYGSAGEAAECEAREVTGPDIRPGLVLKRGDSYLIFHRSQPRPGDHERVYFYEALCEFEGGLYYGSRDSHTESASMLALQSVGGFIRALEEEELAHILGVRQYKLHVVDADGFDIEELFKEFRLSREDLYSENPFPEE
jgi:hypothetical protein